jgi:hypothetical protein
MPSDVFFTMDMDTNYQVGLTWARQAGLRVILHPTSFWSIGMSVENPEQYAPSSVVFPDANFTAQFDNGSSSTSATSAGTNTTTPNLHPDVIIKTAFDGKVGEKKMHFELAGIGRSFKVYSDLTKPGITNTSQGGGGSANFNLEVIRHLNLIADSFYSCGGGRYIYGLGTDAVVRYNGHVACEHEGSGIGGFEAQATAKFMVYGYYGGTYFQRNYDFIGAGSGSTTYGIPCSVAPSGYNCEGFGFPGSSGSSNKSIQEGTMGFIPTLWTNPKYGKLQLITQYSYLTRAPWYVKTGNPKNAHADLVYVDLRYVLP